MTYDVTIIGSGPGGYVAAIRCAQLGMKTAIIERYPTLGGTCLNVGCIPSKALLDSSEHYHDAVHRFAEHGISVGEVKVDMSQMMTRKSGVVEQMTKGVAFLMKKNKVEVIQGHGSFKDANTIVIKTEDGATSEITTKRVIIATGSKPIVPPAFNYDKKRIITSTEALKLQAVPKSMVVIGGGVIGLELGQRLRATRLRGQRHRVRRPHHRRHGRRLLQGTHAFAQEDRRQLPPQARRPKGRSERGRQHRGEFCRKGKRGRCQDPRSGLLPRGHRPRTVHCQPRS